MINNVLKWSLAIVVLLSVLFPVGAYFGTVAVFILAIKARKSRQILSELSGDKQLLAMLFCILLSAIYSQDKLMSIGAAILLCLNLGLYAVILNELKGITLERYSRLLNMICLTACIFGIYQALSGNLIINKSWMDEKTFGSFARIYSTLLNPNIFAGFLAMNLSFAIAKFERLKEDILLSINIVAASICLLLTYSRGGFAAFLAAMLVLILLKRSKGIALYLFFMVSVFLFINSAGPTSRADIGAVYRDSSTLYRLEIWKAAFGMFRDNPLFGSGIGTTWYYLSSGSDKLYRYILHSHNIYLQIAAEMGISGLLGFSYLIVSKLRDCFRLLKHGETGRDAYAVQGFIACVAGIMVHGLIDAVVFVPALSLVAMGYFAMYSRAAAIYKLEGTAEFNALPAWGRNTSKLLEGKGAFKLLGGESACEDEYQEKESKAYQA